MFVEAYTNVTNILLYTGLHSYAMVKRSTKYAFGQQYIKPLIIYTRCWLEKWHERYIGAGFRDFWRHRFCQV
ncbi:hypothetical protein BJV82DRAFT_588235 [Fennellomyces sp. T-0311]|nr:hypothetical protein BJV82DRAFT_588235 [Fennellomyces sp. T-0311]